MSRWDTPQHVLTDDADGTDQPEIWPGISSTCRPLINTQFVWLGKDYSNPRILDFHTLNKPEEDMYDRTKCPRMPW